jgi:hypothetical protein
LIQTVFSLVVASRLLPAERVGHLLDRVRPDLGNPLMRATVLEAEAWIGGKAAAFWDPAERYASLKMPYEEARCRLEAGEIDTAGALIKQFGLEKGPLGARLRELSGSPQQATSGGESLASQDTLSRA